MTRAFPNHMRRASPPMSSSWDEPEGLARDREGAMRSIGATAPATKFCLEPWEGIKRAVGGEWLVSKRVPMRGIGILFGESQSFKTFVAMDLGSARRARRGLGGAPVYRRARRLHRGRGRGRRQKAQRGAGKDSRRPPRTSALLSRRCGANLGTGRRRIGLLSLLQSRPRALRLGSSFSIRWRNVSAAAMKTEAG